MKKTRSASLVAIGLAALAAFAVRAASLDTQSLWRDEVDALRFATVRWADLLASFTRPGWNGPLYYVFLRGWVALTGTSEYALRFFSLAFGVLCVPLAYALGCRLFDRRTGLLAAVLIATSPYLAWYGQEVKMYTLLTALALTAIYGLRRAVEGAGWRWWAVPVVATSLAFYSHILAALLIPVQVLLYLAWWPQARRQWRGALVSLACLTLPYLPLVLWQAPLVLQSRETGFYAYTLGEMVRILLNGWSAGMHGWGWPWSAVLMGGLAAWGLVCPTGGTLVKVRQPVSSQEAHALATVSPAPVKWVTFVRVGDGGKGRGAGRLALVGWLATPLLLVWLISLRQPLFTDRYLIWAAPAFYLLVALGLARVGRLGDRASRRGLGQTLARAAVVLLTGVILISDGVNLWRQATIPIKSDFRAAAAHVAHYREPDGPVAHQVNGAGEGAFKSYLPIVARGGFDDMIIFQIPYGRYTFDYYFPVEGYPSAEGLYTNHRTPDGAYLIGEQDVARRMQEITAGYDAVWLVVTEMEMWDQRGLVRGWLEANARRVDEAHFTRVDVYRYVMRDA